METKNYRRSGFAKIDKTLGVAAKRYHLEAAINRYKVLKGLAAGGCRIVFG